MWSKLTPLAKQPMERSTTSALRAPLINGSEFVICRRTAQVLLTTGSLITTPIGHLDEPLSTSNQGRTLTYGDLHQRIDGLCASAGVGVSRVIVWRYWHTAVQNISTQFAGMHIGSIAVLNWRLAVPELEFIVNGDCTPSVFCSRPNLPDTAQELTSRCGAP